MKKIYYLNPKIKYPLIILSVILFSITIYGPFSFNLNDLFYFISCISLFFLALFYIIYGKVTIDNKLITSGRVFYFNFSRTLGLEVIESIKFSRLLGIPTFVLLPYGSKWDKILGKIKLSIVIKNYKQMLRDIIMMTYKETQIDPKVLKYAGLTDSDLDTRKSYK